MNLLLFLSAVLTALTGVGAGVRRPDVTPEVALVRASRSIAPDAVVQAIQPKATFPTLVDSAILGSIPTMSPAPAAPIWADRRRE